MAFITVIFFNTEILPITANIANFWLTVMVCVKISKVDISSAGMSFSLRKFSCYFHTDFDRFVNFLSTPDIFKYSEDVVVD